MALPALLSSSVAFPASLALTFQQTDEDTAGGTDAQQRNRKLYHSRQHPLHLLAKSTSLGANPDALLLRPVTFPAVRHPR